MATVREQIVAMAATVLETGRPSGVPSPIRTRLETVAAADLPAITVYQRAEQVRRMHDPRPGQTMRTAGPVVRRTLILVVETLTKRVGDTREDQAADPMLAWATAALIGKMELDRFSGLVNDFDEAGTEFAYEQSDHAYCRATQLFEVHYQSKTSNAEMVT
jgi:hypothetical protein